MWMSGGGKAGKPCADLAAGFPCVRVKRIMDPTIVFIVIVGLCVIAYVAGLKRAYSVVGGRSKVQNLHSLPSYYGWLAALWCGVPALVLYGFWVAFEPSIIIGTVLNHLPPEMRDLSPDRMTLVVNDIKNLVSGAISTSDDQALLAAAKDYGQVERSESHCLGGGGPVSRRCRGIRGLLEDAPGNAGTQPGGIRPESDHGDLFHHCHPDDHRHHRVGSL